MREHTANLMAAFTDAFQSFFPAWEGLFCGQNTLISVLVPSPYLSSFILYCPQLLGQYNAVSILLVCRCIWNVRDAEAWLMCFAEPFFGDVQIKSVYSLRDLWFMWLCVMLIGKQDSFCVNKYYDLGT